MNKVEYFPLESVEENINTAKNILLRAMFKNKAIDEKTYIEWSRNYAIIIKKPTFFNKFWGKIFDDSDDLNIIVVKNMSLTEEEEI